MSNIENSATLTCETDEVGLIRVEKFDKSLTQPAAYVQDPMDVNFIKFTYVLEDPAKRDDELMLAEFSCVDATGDREKRATDLTLKSEDNGATFYAQTRTDTFPAKGTFEMSAILKSDKEDLKPGRLYVGFACV